MKFRTNVKRAALAAVIAFSSHTAANAIDYTWQGTTGDIAVGTNWTPTGGPPHLNAQTNVAHFGATGVTNLTMAASSNFWVRQLAFDAGAQAYTLTAASNANTYISLNAISNLGPALTPATTALINNSSNQQIINFPGLGKIGITGIINTGTAAGGSLVINAPLSVGDGSAVTSNLTELAGSNNIYFNVDTAINPAGNSSAGAWTTGTQPNNNYSGGVGRFYTSTFSGRAYLGNIGTSYAGNFNIDSTAGGKVRLVHNNALGDAGTNLNRRRTAIAIGGGTTGNGTLEIGDANIGAISVGRWTMYMNGRSGAIADTPHILNVANDNTFTISNDWNTGGISGTAASGNWNIQSDSGTLTMAGGYMYNTANVSTNLQLMGAGNGIVSAPIVKYQANPSLGIVKKGTGTWTLTNANNTDDANIDPFAGNVSVQGGTLALSGAGSFANAASISVQGASSTLDVSGVTGGTYTLNSSNALVTGNGTIVGKIAAASGNTIAPGVNGVGTLSIGGAAPALTLNGGSTLQVDLTGTPTNLGGVNDKIAIGGAGVGNLTMTGSTNVTVTAKNGYLSGGKYSLMTYGGTLSGNAANLALNPGQFQSFRQSYALDSSIANQVDLVVTNDVGNLTWVGGVNGDVWVDGQLDSNSVNWSGHATDNRFYNVDNVTFGSTGTSTVNVNGTVAPSNVSFTNGSGQNYTINGGTISTAVDMTFSGSGNVNLGVSATTVGGAFTSTGSGNFTISSGSFGAGSFTQNGTGAIIFANNSNSLTLPATLNINTGTVAFNRSDDLSVSNALSGAGTFRKDNSNTVTLTGNNTAFAGTSLVTGGTLKIAGATSLTNTTVENGATLYFDVGAGGDAVVSPSGKAVTISGTGVSGNGAIVALTTSGTAEVNAKIGALTLTGNSKIAVGSSTGTGRSIIWIGGPITGNGHNLDVVVAPGTVGNEIDAINNGATNLNDISVTGGGVFYTGGNTSLGSIGTISLGDGVTTGRLGLYTIGTNAQTVAVNKPIAVPAGAVGGVELWYDANQTISSPISIGANGRFEALLYTRTNNTISKLTLTNKITGDGGFSVHVDANGTVSRAGVVEVTSDANDYTGPTVVGGGGGITALATPLNDRVYLSIGNGGTTGVIPGSVITVMDAGGLLLNRSDNITFSQRVTGTGLLANKAGVTTITNTSNDYSGGTIILGGTLKPGAANVLGSGILMFGDTFSNTNGNFDTNGFSLTFPQLVVQSNSTTANNMTITTGSTVTLTPGVGVTNLLVVGGMTGTTTVGSRLNVSGGGSLVMTDNTKNLVVASRGEGVTVAQSTLDLGGLANFTASVANIYVARPTLSSGGFSGTGTGNDTLVLAANNNITVTGNITAGGTNASEGSGTIRLGQSNTISANQWVIGSARDNGTLNFNSGLTNPTATLYGMGGVGTRTNMIIGDHINAGGISSTGGSTQMVGTVDFTAGAVTAFVDNLSVGYGATAGSGFRGRGTGVFKSGAGSNIDVNTVSIGTAGDTATTSANGVQATSSVGTVEISGGTMQINTALTIARDLDTTATATGIQDVTGTFSVTGGSVTVGSVGTPVNTVLGSHINNGTIATGNAGTNTANLSITGGTYTSNGDIIQGAFGANVGTITLDGGTLNMVNHTIGNATAITNVNLMSGTLSNVGQINNGLSGLTKTSAGTLVLSGSNTYTGNTTVSAGTLNITGNHTTGANYSVASGANLVTKNVRVTNGLTVNGTATITANGGAAGASKVETLTIGAGGKLNLKDNDLVVGSAPNFNAVRTAIIAGKTNNAAAGITSDITGFGISRGFGYAMGNDPKVSSLLAGSLSGQAYDADSVLVKYTLLGDADLDGDTDLNDLGLWSSGYTGDLGVTTSPTTFWTNGDFDYDGDTDLNDLGLWSSTYTGDFNGGPGSLVLDAPGATAEAVAILNSMGITVVPEPSTFVLAGVGLAGLAIAARRRKK